MKSFTIVTFPFILFGGFLLTLCDETNVDILNSLLDAKKWTLGVQYTYYNYCNLNKYDLLITDYNEKIVTEYNVDIVLANLSQLISYEYAITVHWLANMLITLNTYFSINYKSACCETQNEFMETLTKCMTKLKELTKKFVSALIYINKLNITVQKPFLTNFISTLLNFNNFKFEPDINNMDSLYEDVIRISIDTFSSTQSLILKYFELTPNISMINSNHDLDLKYQHKSYDTGITEEERKHLKLHSDLILNSVDELIQIKYTNLGFRYNETSEITYCDTKINMDKTIQLFK
ncbi:uncharacterized protein LOC126899543 isoform X1 [Daktulosphaira vitifoliae]|uniref:uncharacterized protein LOC126899543 isoform X1 n=1 Tax=Daktulosphaira vitifoliae TaxID=58002 RepID=UPI0021A9FB2A|nr:uncharacterized protein LOC126899543 isoform X1 [Daktulosphaira vitifoliae]